MSCDGYNKTALMGNWYEERLAISQPMKKEPDFRATRQEETSISFLSNKNLLQPLGRVPRTHKWDTTHVMVDDGFREFRTVNQTSYDPIYLQNRQYLRDCRNIAKSEQPRKDFPEFATQIQTSGTSTYKLLNRDNVLPQILENQRDVKMHTSDFGSTFNTHHKDHQRLYDVTTYQAYHDRPTKPTPDDVIRTQGEKLRSQAGWNKTRQEEQQGPKMVGGLTGEAYKNERDPQQNTRVQRAWLPYNETALDVIEHNIRSNELSNSSMGLRTADRFTNYRQNTSQKLTHDIATSLPLEGGLETLRSKYMEPGAYRKIRTDVTLTRNAPITKK